MELYGFTRWAYCHKQAVMPEWTVEITGNPLRDLEQSLFDGPILNESGQRWLNERELDRVGGLRIQMFSNEHPPPHFRVFYQGETANYRISDCVQLNGGLEKFYRNIKEWHAQNQRFLIDSWNNSRPTNCPVGRYQEQTKA